jgi:hypothetical protein
MKVDFKNPKVIYGSIAVVVVIIVFIILRKKSNNPIFDKKNNGLSSGLSLSQNEANLIAANLLTAMEGWGTDEEAIFYNLSKATTKEDLLLIIEAFGLKPKAKMKSLNEWLKDELSGSDLRDVKAIFDNLGVPF